MLDLIQNWIHRPNIVVFVILFLWGFYISMTHGNLIRKLIGLYIVQTSAILFLVTLAAKDGATVPILDAGSTDPIDAAAYANPLPHVLTLTAIVVQVATLGVSLAIVAAMYRRSGSLDENDIARELE